MISIGALISPAYLELQRQLHAQRTYGQHGDKWAKSVCDYVAELGATSVLDYGCGQGTLKRALKPLCGPTIRIDEYDPAIAGKDGIPIFADLVVCTDVLEHVERDRLGAVLAHLKLLARKAVFAVVSLKTAKHVLADGRNAHLIVESSDWWIETFAASGFTVIPGPARPGEKIARELSVLLTSREGA